MLNGLLMIGFLPHAMSEGFTKMHKEEAEKNECTYAGEGIHMFICNNCGAQSENIETINHHNTCKNGEAKKWEKFYEDANEEQRRFEGEEEPFKFTPTPIW